MSWALVNDNDYGYTSGLAEVECENGVFIIKSIDMFCGVHQNRVWESEFSKSIYERTISFYNSKFDNRTWYGIVISKYERDRIGEMFNHLPAYVRFLELGKLPK